MNTVDLATGDTTFRANTSATGQASAFASDGTYFHLDSEADVLNTVDIDTGAITQIGDLGYDSVATNLGYNPSDGFLYSIQIQDPNYPLYRIDPATGAGVLVGNVTGLPDNPSQQITAGTFALTSPIPEPSTIAIWSLLGLVGFGLAWRKRKA